MGVTSNSSHNLEKNYWPSYATVGSILIQLLSFRFDFLHSMATCYKLMYLLSLRTCFYVCGFSESPNFSVCGDDILIPGQN